MYAYGYQSTAKVYPIVCVWGTGEGGLASPDIVENGELWQCQNRVSRAGEANQKHSENKETHLNLVGTKELHLVGQEVLQILVPLPILIAAL